MVTVAVFDAYGLQAFQTPAEFGEVESIARDALPFDVVPCSGGGCCRVQFHIVFYGLLFGLFSSDITARRLAAFRPLFSDLEQLFTVFWQRFRDVGQV
jgi:hypothetical protein